MIKNQRQLVAIFTFCLALVSFAQEVKQSSFTYESTIDGVTSKLNYQVLNSGGAEVAVTGIFQEGNPVKVTVPEYAYDGDSKPYQVVAVGSSAFKPSGTATSQLSCIVLPKSVRTIEEEAFRDCGKLTNINFPEGLTWIGKSAFANCKDLNIDEKTFPLSCDLGIDCFEGTYWLNNKSAGTPVYLSRIFYKLREGDGLTDGRLEVREGTLQISGGACLGRTQLQTLVLPTSVQRIGKVAFSGCTALRDAQLSQIGEIDDGAFLGCTSLTKLQFLVTAAPKLGTEPVFPLKSELQQQITLEYPKAATGFDKAPWTELGTHEKKNILVINDNAKATQGADDTYDQVVYSRKYSHNKWQALYLPFAMSVDDWKTHFDVARLNNFHQYDDNGDGKIDRTELEVFFVRQGEIQANVPYMIRAKQADRYAVQTIVLAKNGGVPVQYTEGGSLHCSSTTTDYTFTGSYQPYFGTGHYVMLGGELRPVDNDQLQLGGYRWRLTMAPKSTSATVSMSKIKVVDNGNPSTGVESVMEDKSGGTYDVYDLSGRRVAQGARSLQGLPHGFYIVNGKKVFCK